MTNQEKFKKGIVVYEVEGGDWVCEIWSGSTKHPARIERFSEWGDDTDMFDVKYQIFQWLLWIASRSTFPFHAKEIAEYALEFWYNW